MDTTREQREAFAQLLTARMNEHQLTAPALAAVLREAGFENVRHQHVYQWRGGQIPRDPGLVAAVDAAVLAGGDLVHIAQGTEGIDRRLAALEDRMDRIEGRIEEVLRLMRSRQRR